MLPEAPASLDNSSGIFLGLALSISISPARALRSTASTRRPDEANPMLPVVRLEAKIIQTRSIESRRRRRLRPCVSGQRSDAAATISLGYADGWHRRAASAAWFDGVRLPFAGRVSMD